MSGNQVDSGQNVSSATSRRCRAAVQMLVAALVLLLSPALEAFAETPVTQPSRLIQVAQAAKQATPESIAGPVAFAKASPLLVYSSPASSGGKKEDFEFGKPYEVIEESAEYVKIKLRSGETAYVRSAHVTTMRSPRWLTTTTGYNRTERPRIRLWESVVKLNDFLSGINTAGSQWDFEEYFDAAPSFQLSLPIIETDTLDLLGGSRPVKVASVLMPISRQMYQAFEGAKSGSEKSLALHFLIDVSGSTKGFREPVYAAVAKAVGRNDEFRKRLRTITVTAFGASRSEKSSFLGKFSLKDIDGIKLDRTGDQTTTGDREPLIDGFVAMNTGLVAKSDEAPLLLILSGADVELESSVRGKSVTIENLNLALPADAAAIFAQITPEPGTDLRNASRRLQNVPRIRYLDYSDALADDVVSELIRTAEAQRTVSISAESFGPLAKAALEKRMMGFLPRVLTPASSLPARLTYAAQSDWYTVRLWLTLDGLIWKEASQ